MSLSHLGAGSLVASAGKTETHLLPDESQSLWCWVTGGQVLIGKEHEVKLVSCDSCKRQVTQMASGI
jgi:hypothetical protein